METASSPVVVLVMSFLTMFLGSSLMTASGVIHIALLTEFGQSVAMTAWVGSLFSSFFCLGGPLAGAVINSYGCRACIIIGGILNLVAFTSSSFCNNLYIMFFTFGVCGGLGQCFGYTGSYVAIGFYYQSRRSLGIGIVVSGYAMGQIIYPFFTQLLLAEYHLKGTLLILGGIGFHICVFGACIRPHPVEREIQATIKLKQKSKKTSLNFRNTCDILQKYIDILGNKSFLLFCCSIFCWSISLASTVIYITDYFHHTGSPLMEASYLTSLIGIGSIVSRVLVGLATSDGGLDPQLIYFGCYVILGVSTLCFNIYGIHHAGKVMYSVISGFYQGGTWTLLGPISVELVGIMNLASAFSIGMLFAGIGFLIGPLIGGVLVEADLSFKLLFLFIGIMYSMASVFGLFMMLTHQSASKEDIPQNNDKKELELIVKSDAGPDVPDDSGEESEASKPLTAS